MPRIPRYEIEPVIIIGTEKARRAVFEKMPKEGYRLFERLRYRLHKMNLEARPYGLQVVLMIPGTKVWAFDPDFPHTNGG